MPNIYNPKIIYAIIWLLFLTALKRAILINNAFVYSVRAFIVMLVAPAKGQNILAIYYHKASLITSNRYHAGAPGSHVLFYLQESDA